jgi:hypothetical protein
MSSHLGSGSKVTEDDIFKGLRLPILAAWLGCDGSSRCSNMLGQIVNAIKVGMFDMRSIKGNEELRNKKEKVNCMSRRF